MACKDCRKVERLAICEKHNPSQSKICKDCCITGFNGHKCPFWIVCWS